MAWRRGQAYGQDLRDRVLAADDEPIREMAQRLSVSPSYVVNVRARLREMGERAGRPQRSQLPLRLGPMLSALRTRATSDATVSSSDVIDVLADLFIARGAPAHIRSDQGPEFVAAAVNGWIEGVGAKTAYIEKASPWENGYVESFNGKLRDEVLNGEVFNTLREAQVLIEGWRQHYNRVRPHSALSYHPPAPETVPIASPQIRSGAGPAAMAH